MNASVPSESLVTIFLCVLCFVLLCLIVELCAVVVVVFSSVRVCVYEFLLLSRLPLFYNSAIIVFNL